jgi:hypothetical protein
MLMRIKLEAHGLPHPGDAEFQLDWMALDAIYNAVPVEMLPSITTKDMDRCVGEYQENVYQR